MSTQAWETRPSQPQQKQSKRAKRLPYDWQKVNQLILEATKQVPERARPYVRALAPVIATAGLVFSIIAPTLEAILKMLTKVCGFLGSICPEGLVEPLFGLTICFFGGSYPLLISAVEAWRASSWGQNKKDLAVLWHDLSKYRAAQAKDDEEDEDNDGIADVDQATAMQLLARRSNLLLVSVDPEKLSLALANLYTAFLAIIATLKIEFARAVALGNSIGDVLAKPASRCITPIVSLILPAAYKKWANPSVRFAVKFGAIQFAWYLRRIVSSLQSALRGGQLFAVGVISYRYRSKGKIFNAADSWADEVIGFSMAGFGFLVQYFLDFGVPFPLNLIFVPFTIAEKILTYYVSVAKRE